MLIKTILNSAKVEIVSITTLRELQNFRVKYLGQSSVINKAIHNIGTVRPKERKKIGQEIHQAKQELEKIIHEQELIVEKHELTQRFIEEQVDLTIPARKKVKGSIHPITQCLDELIQVFAKYGFDIKDGPNIEDEWHNFTALNIDKHHPARQMHDTFYLKNTNGITKVLRTHTSPIQIRTMQTEEPPYRFIAPGRTYRSDSDCTHTPMFHQIEGIVLDKNIHFGHLKYVITDFIHTFFEKSPIEVQFRPSFFPFTEPSAEVDIKVNKSDNWLEVLGCGMIHPNILKNVGINAEKYQGFAFGLGVERFAMLKYGIRDVRQFFEGDIRWLKHYNFATLDIPTLTGGLTR